MLENKQTRRLRNGPGLLPQTDRAASLCPGKMSREKHKGGRLVLAMFCFGFIGGRVAAASQENVMISRDTDGNEMVESYQLTNNQVRVWEGSR